MDEGRNSCIFLLLRLLAISVNPKILQKDMDMGQSSTVTLRGSKDIFLPIELNIILYLLNRRMCQNLTTIDKGNGETVLQHPND